MPDADPQVSCRIAEADEVDGDGANDKRKYDASALAVTEGLWLVVAVGKAREHMIAESPAPRLLALGSSDFDTR